MICECFSHVNSVFFFSKSTKILFGIGILPKTEDIPQSKSCHENNSGVTQFNYKLF